MDDRTVVAGTQLGGKVAGAAAEQGWQFIGVIVHQPAGDNQSIWIYQLNRLARGELTAYGGDAGREQRGLALGERAHGPSVEDQGAASVARMSQP